MSDIDRLSRRVKALEQERRQRSLAGGAASKRKRLEEAAAKGTATLEEYGELWSEAIAWLRAFYLASVPFLAACMDAGFSVAGPYGGGACPPDRSPPPSTVEWLDLVERVATSDLSRPRPASMRAGLFDPLWNPGYRESCAVFHLAVGGGRAMSIRQEAWTRSEDSRWEISAAAHSAASEMGLTRDELSALIVHGGWIHGHYGTAQRLDKLRAELMREVGAEGGSLITFAALTALIQGAQERLTMAQSGSVQERKPSAPPSVHR